MRLAAAMGVRPLRLLRSHSPPEIAVFWAVLILSYLALYGLATTPGVGYTERADVATESISFDLNSVLWFPDVFLHTDPGANSVPFLLWWVILAFLIAEGSMIFYRLLRGDARARIPASGQTKKSRFA